MVTFVKTCDPERRLSDVGEMKCANITIIAGRILDDTRYDVYMEEGVEYSSDHGALKKEMSASFGGLRLFRIPFQSPMTYSSKEYRYVTKYFDIWLPHGTGVEQTIFDIPLELTDVRSGDSVAFERRESSPSIMRLTTDVAPGRKYRIEALNSTMARDGYGRALIGTDLILITRNIQNQFVAVKPSDRRAVFEKGQPWGSRLVLFTKGEPGREDTWEVAANAVEDSVELATLLIYGYRLHYNNNRSTVLGEEDMTLQASAEDPLGTVTSHSIEGLIGETGIIAYQNRKKKQDYERFYIFAETSLIVAVTTYQRLERKFVAAVFVTDMESGQPVKGLNVTFFAEASGRFEVEKVGETTVTDNAGVAKIYLGDQDELVAVIQEGPRLMYVEDIYTSWSSPSSGADALILDRKLIQPNETLYVKGYLRDFSGTELVLPSSRNAFLALTPGFDNAYPSTEFPIKISDEFGSYEAEIVVPENATLREYEVQLQSGQSGVARVRNNYYGSSERFTVGLPRRPTVELSVEATEWTTPTGTATLTVTATSFIGASVGDQAITVDWRIRFYKDGEHLKEEGKESLLTDSQGFAEVTINLAKLETAPPSGNRLDFDIHWVGPTGELIEESANTRIAWADLKIDIKRSVKTNIPQQGFGVWVELADLDGRPLAADSPFKSVEISLKPAPDGGSYETVDRTPLNTPAEASCTYEVDGSEPCDISLPSMGVFVLEACASSGSTTLCSRESLGKSREEWTRRPWKGFMPVGIRLMDAGSYQSGDVAEIIFDNPYENVYAMILWGNSEEMKSSVQAIPGSQRSTVSVELSDMCQFGCQISVDLSIPRQTTGLATDPSVPVAKLHDPAMPHTFHWEESIRLEASDDKKIDISFDFPEASVEDGDTVLRPGSNVTMEVELGTERTSEVTVIIVEKAILELVSNPLTALGDGFEIDLGVRFSHESSSGDMVSPRAMQELILDFERKKEINPWFQINYGLHVDDYNSDELDLSTEAYINQISTYITVSPGQDEYYYSYDYSSYGFRSAIAPEAADAPLEAEASSYDYHQAESRVAATSASSAASSTFAPAAPAMIGALRIESDFEPNVLFVTETTKNGRVTLNFEAPVQLSAFVVRAYAASGVDSFGSADTEFVVRRQVSLTPSVPRFVRVEDIFMAGVVITVSGSPDTEIELRVETEGPIAVNGPRKRRVSVGDDKQEEARFEFKALGMGEANLTFTASDTDGKRDAVQVSLQIEGLQEAVVVGTSFVLTASDGSAESEEGLDLPLAVPGSGSIVVVAGVGQEPAVLSLVEQLLSRDPKFECPYSSGLVIGATLIPAIINPYDPWDAPDQEGLVKNVLEMFERAADLISVGPNKMTRRDLGLLSYLPCVRQERELPEEASLYPNVQALWLMNEVQRELEEHPVSAVANHTSKLFQARKVWRRVAGKVCVDEAKRSRRKRGRQVDLWTVTQCRAGLGADWGPPAKAGDRIKEDLSMERLGKHFDKLGLESQALYVLTLQTGQPDHPDVQKAVKRWTGLYRVTGRTAYISAYEGAATPASTLANTLILMAMTRAGTEGQLLPKLAAYVAAPVTDSYGFGYFDSFSMAVTMWALVVYDASRDNTQPDVYLRVRSDGFSLLEATFDDDSPAVVTNTTDWNDLGKEPGPIQFSAVGSGEVSVAVTLNFVPLEVLPFPSYRGIFVQRTIQLEESGEGGSLAVIPQGVTVFVQVQFMTPDSLQETIVRVLMPAGLEPVDPNIADGGPVCPVPFFSFYRYYEPCPRQETRPTVVSFEYLSVRAGTHTVSFRAVAVTTGLFTLPPTRVFVRDQPEVMGLSSAGKIEICEGDCEAVHETETFQPQSCPDDCNGNGSCNIKEGTCICFRGFFGKSCAKTAAK